MINECGDCNQIGLAVFECIGDVLGEGFIAEMIEVNGMSFAFADRLRTLSASGI